jgi:uncharacterized repeat protein (TIGR03803 family)
LRSFQSGIDGAYPASNLVFDRSGNLYGTTSRGGGCGGVGCGTVFELSPPTAPGGAWTEQVIYSFQGGRDGASPVGNLAIDAKGNLYGVTAGSGKCTFCGTVFKLVPPTVSGGAWTEHIVDYFQNNSSDGMGPAAGPTRHEGLYGTTQFGGQLGQGTVYQVTAGAGGPTETVLYSFGSDPADVEPLAGVIFDKAGNLYGSASGSGSGQGGTVFELQPPSQTGGNWTEIVLHTFTGGTDGLLPMGLLLRRAGTLYGTTGLGGGGGGTTCGSTGCGVVFAITP